MTRLPNRQRLTAAVLGSVLLLSSTTTAFAREPIDKDKDAQRPRKQQAQQQPQREVAPARVEPAQRPQPQREVAPARVERAQQTQPQRRDDWGEIARQRAANEQARQRGEAGRATAQNSEQDARRADEQRGQQGSRNYGQPGNDWRQDRNDDRQSPQGDSRANSNQQRGQQGPRNYGQSGNDWQHGRNDNRQSPQGDYRLNRDQQRQAEEWRRRAENWQRDQRNHREDFARRSRLLDQQRRNAQYRYQQDYLRRLLAQQARWNNASYYNSYYNQNYWTGASYRYHYGGRYYTTNRYGADMLQQAVQDGYREGWYAGQADRQDRWRFDYRNSSIYQQANYGYNGYYVGYDTYQYYFRQGFERGYQDAYYGNMRYGRYGHDGVAAILPAILVAILGYSLYN